MKPKLKFETFTDKRDGQVYKTVRIGNQIWMAENLRYVSKGGNADDLRGSWEASEAQYYPEIDDEADDFSSSIDLSYGVPPNAGRLYTWFAAMDIDPDKTREHTPRDIKHAIKAGKYRGIAPEGFHVPSSDEFRQLYDYIQTYGCDEDSPSPAYKDVGKCLKDSQYWDGTNNFGFSALPTGLYGFDSHYQEFGNNAYFWTTTERQNGNAVYWSMEKLDNDFNTSYIGKFLAFAIRCVKDL